MDRNQIIGISLIALIVVAFSIYNRPSPEEIQREQALRDSLEAVEKAQVDASEAIEEERPQIIAADEADTLAPTQEEEFFTLQNPKLEVRISNRGGKVAYLKLKEYQRHDSTELVLVEPGSNHFGFNVGDGSNTDGLWFSKVGQTDSSLTLRAKVSSGAVLFTYTMSKDDYQVKFDTDWEGVKPSKLVWTQEIIQQEKRIENERMKTSIYFKNDGEKPDYVSERKDEDEEQLGEDGTVEWIAFKQQFFSQALVPDKNYPKGYLSQNWQEGDEFVRQLHASMDLEESSDHSFTYFFVPNHYKTLKKYDLGLERLIYLGWGIFGWVNRFFVIPIFNILSQVTHNYGVIIAILTLLFKGLLLFFTYKAFLSGAKMRVLKPELDAIKKKHDGDMQTQQSEQMKLYQATGVSPLGGCLPLFVQMPILLALFNFFPNSFELRQKSFLWVTDLSTYDAVISWGGNIPVIDWIFQGHISLFAVLMTISTFIYTLINQSYQPQQQKELKYLPYIMPFIFLTFLNNYSAALSYYYFLANVISIGQTFLFKAFINEDKLRAQIAETREKKKANGKGGAAPTGMQGKMQDWLEKQQRKQQAQQQKPKKRK